MKAGYLSPTSQVQLDIRSHVNLPTEASKNGLLLYPHLKGILTTKWPINKNLWETWWFLRWKCGYVPTAPDEFSTGWKIWTDNLFSRDRSWTFCSVHTYLWTAGRLHFRTVKLIDFVWTEYLNARIVQPVKNSSGACRVNVACVFLNYWLGWTYCPCKNEAFNRLNWFEVLFFKKNWSIQSTKGLRITSFVRYK